MQRKKKLCVGHGRVTQTLLVIAKKLQQTTTNGTWHFGTFKKYPFTSGVSVASHINPKYAKHQKAFQIRLFCERSESSLPITKHCQRSETRMSKNRNRQFENQIFCERSEPRMSKRNWKSLKIRSFCERSEPRMSKSNWKSLNIRFFCERSEPRLSKRNGRKV